MWRLTGDYPGAARDLEEALAILRDIGARDGMVEILNEFGTLHRTGGDLVQARSRYQEALDLARADGIRWDEAHALAGLGRCALAAFGGYYGALAAGSNASGGARDGRCALRTVAGVPRAGSLTLKKYLAQECAYAGRHVTEQPLHRHPFSFRPS